MWLVNAIALALLLVVKWSGSFQALVKAAVCAGIRVNLAQRVDKVARHR